MLRHLLGMETLHGSLSPITVGVVLIKVVSVCTLHHM